MAKVISWHTFVSSLAVQPPSSRFALLPLELRGMLVRFLVGPPPPMPQLDCHPYENIRPVADLLVPHASASSMELENRWRTRSTYFYIHSTDLMRKPCHGPFMLRLHWRFVVCYECLERMSRHAKGLVTKCDANGKVIGFRCADCNRYIDELIPTRKRMLEEEEEEPL